MLKFIGILAGLSLAYASIFDGPISRGPSSVHDGYDYPTSYGTPVDARQSGTVTLVGYRPGYGLTIAVDIGRCRQIYAHLSGAAVSPGQTISAGQIIGRAGRNGRVRLSKSSAVLHWEPCSSLYGEGITPDARSRSRRRQEPVPVEISPHLDPARGSSQ